MNHAFYALFGYYGPAGDAVVVRHAEDRRYTTLTASSAARGNNGNNVDWECVAWASYASYGRHAANPMGLAAPSSARFGP